MLAPRSIALVGASDDPSKTSSRPLQYLRSCGYQGVVYPINPRRASVLGERAWPSLSDLPQVPDHAFVLTPTEEAIEAAQEAARLGVGVVTILATGFTESGADAQANVSRLRAVCRHSNLRILGPSSLGAINLHQKTVITANAAFAEPDLPVGGTFVASHSGSLLGGLISRGKEKGVGFAGLISVGNELDLSLGEICSATLDDPNVTRYMLFLESLRHADALRAFAIGAAQRGKPVLAYKLGRSAAAAELALSHTGALAGEDDIANAFLADCGIARIDNFETLLEALPLLDRISPGAVTGRKPQVGVVTTTGGGAAMIVDNLALRGVEVVKPSDATYRRMIANGVIAQHDRIVDLTLAGTRYDVMKAALDAMLAAPEFDLVVAVTGSSGRFQPELAVKPVIDSASAAKPLVSFVVPAAPEALRRILQAGIAAFRTPESCADAVQAAFRRRPAKSFAGSRSVPTDLVSRNLDELEAYRILDDLRIPRAPAVAIDIEEALPPLPFAYPVAVKALSAEIPHKTNVGAVVLNVMDEPELRAARRHIGESVRRALPYLTLQQVLVQPMTRGLGEVLVGFKRDIDAGPIVLVAAGGIYTEIYRDRAIRLAPVTIEVAREMIDELAIAQVFRGFRGKPAGDLEALARVIVAISNLADGAHAAVIDAEINPLIVCRTGEGVIAVDALVRTVLSRQGD